MKKFIAGIRDALTSCGLFAVLSTIYIQIKEIDISAPANGHDIIVFFGLLVVSLVGCAGINRYLEEQK